VSQSLARYSNILEIVGDILKVRVPAPGEGGEGSVAFDDLAIVQDRGGFRSLARVIRLDDDVVSLQVFAGTKGLSNVPSIPAPTCRRIRSCRSAVPR
jgi:V/A-type H+-transporting ATPase subunit B